MELEIIFYKALNIIVNIINFVGVTIVIWGFVVSAIAFVRIKLHHHTLSFFFVETNKIRSVLGIYILFGLEFMIAADIIHTFIRPTKEDLIVLATIVAIRTVISYFMSREVEETRHDQDATKDLESKQTSKAKNF
jgi:uncharacterized membrane protein